MASRPPALALALAGGLGIAFGVATLTVLWALYPVTRGEGWIVVGIGIASLVVVGGVHRLLTRIGAPGVCDSFLLGYVIGLVTVAVVMMANEIVPKLRRRLPSVVLAQPAAVRTASYSRRPSGLLSEEHASNDAERDRFCRPRVSLC